MSCQLMKLNLKSNYNIVLRIIYFEYIDIQILLLFIGSVIEAQLMQNAFNQQPMNLSNAAFTRWPVATGHHNFGQHA